jgi:hypothetical protein
LEEALMIELLFDGNCPSSGWNIWMLLIVCDDDFPRPFFTLYPLAANERSL